MCRSFMGKYNWNQSSPPPGGLHFPSLHLPVTPERRTAVWPSCLKTQPDSDGCQPSSPTRAASLSTRVGGTTPPRCLGAVSRGSAGIPRASDLAASGTGVWRGRDRRRPERNPGFRPPAFQPLQWPLGCPFHPG
ncbi:uncharacterized protein LOC119466951 [Cebus imitator]|uniref:uncharacterized protein LOC119466951 n=1 Tax=Cebus imitator TaxID=2715852 RepID=UPI00189B3C4A|nr:uncharacterized protein LOC119466951 [Cebus imitator]